MRALVLTAFDGPDALELADLPEPEPGPGEELVTVRAVALGPWDRDATHGYFVELGGTTAFPQVQGWDFAGETADGRRVVGFLPQPWTRGVLAERVAVSTALLAPLPDPLTVEQGAAVPVSLLTAALLVDAAQVAAGYTVLVTGAAGMVGGFAVQLARSRGAHVLAAVRERDADEARALGADTVVDSGALPGAVRERWPDGVDACLDTLGLGAAAGDAVRDGGAFATTVPGSAPDPARGVDPATVGARPDTGTLAPLVARAATGELTVRVAEVLPLAEFRRGYALLDRGGLRGKVVLTP